MRARLIALIILLLMVALPLGLYFYFTSSRISSVQVTVGSGTTARVDLRGTFWLDGLPLADSVLSYSQECYESCVIAPVLPAEYRLVLSSTGNVAIQDTLTIHPSEAVTRSYVLVKDVWFAQVGTVSQKSPEIPSELSMLTGMTLIGTDMRGQVWISKEGIGTTEIATFSGTQALIHYALSWKPKALYLDAIGGSLVVEWANKAIIYATDTHDQLEVESPLWTIISASFGKNPRVRTSQKVYDIISWKAVENIRFTDYIDLSPEVRIGYIDASDVTKLALSNFPPNISVLVRLDRRDGNTTVLRTGIDIKTLFLYQGAPAYLDNSDRIFTIQTWS